MDLEKMRACSPLLPPPGGDVVCECLDEIERLRDALEMIILHGDYTAPEGMKRIAKDALTHNVKLTSPPISTLETEK